MTTGRETSRTSWLCRFFLGEFDNLLFLRNFLIILNVQVYGYMFIVFLILLWSLGYVTGPLGLLFLVNRNCCLFFFLDSFAYQFLPKNCFLILLIRSLIFLKTLPYQFQLFRFCFSYSVCVCVRSQYVFLAGWLQLTEIQVSAFQVLD